MPFRVRLIAGLSIALCGSIAASGCTTLSNATASPVPSPAIKTASTRSISPDGADLAKPPPVVSNWSADTLSDLLLGELASQRGQLDVAVDVYLRQASQLRSAEIAGRATRLAWFARLSEPARRAAALWVELAPEDPEANAHAVMSLIQAGEIESAEPLLARLLNNVRHPVRFNFLVQYARESSPELRERVGGLLANLSGRHPDNPRLWLARAAIEEIDSHHENALSFVRKARALQPEDVATLDLEGRLLLTTGQTGEARRHYQRAAKQHPRERDIRLGLLRALLDEGRGDLARAELGRMISVWPDDPELAFSLALLDWETGNADSAQTRMVALAESGFREDDAWMYAGRIAASVHHLDEAAGFFQNVRGSGFVQAQIQLANVWQRAGRLADARALLANLRRQSPDTATTLYIAESDLLWRAGEAMTALPLLEEALVISPGDQDLRYAYALAAERVDRIDLAEKELRALVESAPESAMLLNALGYTLADRTDRHDEARQLIERALVLSPDDPAIIDSMGWVSYRLGELAEAERWLRRAASLSADGEIAAHLGEVLWMAGKQREARRVWARASARDPENLILKRTLERLLK